MECQNHTVFLSIDIEYHRIIYSKILIISPSSGSRNFGGIKILVIDLGLEFCQLNVNKVGHVCATGEKQCLYCSFRQFR